MRKTTKTEKPTVKLQRRLGKVKTNGSPDNVNKSNIRQEIRLLLYA